MHGLSVVAVSWDLLFVALHRLLIAAASLMEEYRFQGLRAQYLWYTGLVALQHVGSSWIGDQTCVPFIGRQIRNHWTTKEVLECAPS